MREEENVLYQERIVNINVLEKKIQKCRFDIINLQKSIEKERLNDSEQIIKTLKKISDNLYECENFEFLLERRNFTD